MGVGDAAASIAGATTQKDLPFITNTVFIVLEEHANVFDEDVFYLGVASISFTFSTIPNQWNLIT